MGKRILTVSDEELRNLYCASGLRLKEIASQYGCAVSTVSLRLKKAGIPARSPHDYPTTPKVREAWRQNGHRSKGHVVTDEQRVKLSAKMNGRRAKSDYEFGGHEKKRSDGYIKVYVPDHPHCSADGYVMKHTLVVERRIGRYLMPDECVHHINHIRDDNRDENLLLMTKTEHQSMHMKERHAERKKARC